VDISSLDEVLHIPNILTVPRGYPQIYLFPNLSVYRLLVCLNCWIENISLEIFLLCFDKELVGIPSSTSSFGLVSCLSKPWEIMLIVCIGRNTFGLS
jgi:hypothetical protein